MADSSVLTPALEDYLEAIYTLQKVKDVVKIGDIAEHLKVTMASVTGGIRRLAAMEFVIYEKWRQVQLTDMGEHVARRVNLRHEELYTFYHEILGSEKTLAEKSACRVEHVLDPSIIQRINFLSSWMQSLPDEIRSDFDNRMRAQFDKPDVKKALTLNKLKTGDKAVVKDIKIQGEIGRRLLDMGVTRGSEIEVIRVAPLGDPIDVRIRGYHLSLRKSEVNGILVEKHE
ncbi:MAG TPA: DtxR family transcriptional regulator [bacterium]|nr:DtxR family transcriptional regulator [bacterium]